VALAWIGWVTIAATRADRLAEGDPEAALRVDPGHPAALLEDARRKLRAGDYPAATALAKRLLAIEPGQGEGFAMLAAIAVARSAPDADALLRIAVRRASRDRDMRSKAAVSALRAGALPEAMAQLDALLRLRVSVSLYPAMVQQSEDPRFAAALAETLAREPPWRDEFLGALLAKGSTRAVDQIYAGLRSRGALSSDETARWLGRMLRDGRWGQAYAHWVATLGPLAGGIPAIYNGGFEQDPSGIGFDWQKVPRAEGVFVELEPVPGATGKRAAHFRFIGPAAGGGLRQPMLLGPGRYRLSLRARAEFLHTEQGLEWEITCDGGDEIATLGPLEGSFDWRALQADFSVPASGCPGQWLELDNPATPGAAQHASGDLWVDDLAIRPGD
jgi:hypothetical protein